MKAKNKNIRSKLSDWLVHEDPLPMDWGYLSQADWRVGEQPKCHEAVRLQSPADPWRSGHRTHEQDSLTEIRRKRQQEEQLSVELECWRDEGEFVA